MTDALVLKHFPEIGQAIFEDTGESTPIVTDDFFGETEFLPGRLNSLHSSLSSHIWHDFATQAIPGMIVNQCDDDHGGAIMEFGFGKVDMPLLIWVFSSHSVVSRRHRCGLWNDRYELAGGNV